MNMYIHNFIKVYAVLAHKVTVERVLFFQKKLNVYVEKYNKGKTLPLKINENGNEYIIPHGQSDRYIQSGELVPDYVEINSTDLDEKELQDILQLSEQNELARKLLFILANKFQRTSLQFSLYCLDSELQEDKPMMLALLKKTLPDFLVKDSIFTACLDTCDIRDTPIDPSKESELEKHYANLNEILQKEDASLNSDVNLMESFNTLMLISIN